MDAVKFIKERNRMCNSISKCDMCSLHGRTTTCIEFTRDYPEEAVKIVEQWGNEHPPKTNREKFEEIFGDQKISPNWWDLEYREPSTFERILSLSEKSRRENE